MEPISQTDLKEIAAEEVLEQVSVDQVEEAVGGNDDLEEDNLAESPPSGRKWWWIGMGVFVVALVLGLVLVLI